MANKGTLTVAILGDTKPIEKTLGGLESTLGGIGTIAGGALAAGFTAAVAGLGAVVFEAISQEASVDRAGAALGLSEKDMEKLADAAGGAYMNAFGASLEENVAVAEGVMRRFGEDLPEDVLQGLVEDAQTIADVFDVDVTEALNAASTLFTNDLAPNADAAMDIVAQALRDTKAPTDEVLSAINEYSSFFEPLGLGADEALGLITSGFSDNQFAIDKAFDAVKEFSIRVIDGSDLSVGALEDLGFAVEDVEDAFADGGPAAEEMTRRIITALINTEDPIERTRLGVALMGTPFEDLGNLAIPILEDLLAGMDPIAGTAETIGDAAFNNIGTRFTEAWRTAKQSVVDTLGPPIVALLEDVAKWLEEELPGAIKEFEKWVKDTLIPTVKEGARIFEENILPAIQAVVVELELFGESLDAEVKAWDEDIEEAKSFWDEHNTAFREAFGESGVELDEFTAGAERSLRTMWSKVEGLFGTGTTNITSDVQTFSTDATTDVESFATTSGRVLGEMWATAIRLFTTGPDDVMKQINELKSDLSGGWEDMKTTARNKWDDLQDLIGVDVGNIKDTILGLFPKVDGGWKDGWNGIFRFGRDTLEDLESKIGEILDGIEGAFETGIEAIGIAWDKLEDAAKDPVNFVIDPVYNEGIKPIWDFFADKVGLGRAPDIALLNKGGFVGGFGPNRDSVPALLTPGEFVLNRQAASTIGPGILDWLNGLSSEHEMARGIRKTGGDISDLQGLNAGGYVNGPMEALDFARRNTGPYLWGGFGPLFDCSGFMAAISNFAATGNFRAGSRWATGQAANRPSSIGRFVQGHGPVEGFNIGISPRGWGAGHTAGTIAGVNVESNGSVGSHVGGPTGASYGELEYHLPDFAGLSEAEKQFLFEMWDNITADMSNFGEFGDLFEVGEHIGKGLADHVLDMLPGFIADFIRGMIGLEHGGFVRAGSNVPAMIGEGRHDEIVSPVPLMRQIVSEEIAKSKGGMFDGATFNFHGTEDEMVGKVGRKVGLEVRWAGG